MDQRGMRGTMSAKWQAAKVICGKEQAAVDEERLVTVRYRKKLMVDDVTAV